MLDDVECLRTNSPLLQLLKHYTDRAQPNPELWQDRVFALKGVESTDLTKLHGDLLANGWIEWAFSTERPSACYRVSSEGVRALRLVDGDGKVDFEVEKPAFKAPRRKKKAEPVSVTVSASA